MKRLRMLSAIAGVAALSLFALSPGRAAAPVDCAPFRASIVVDTSAHRLALCEGGKNVETFGVRLGKHGVGKEREGDGKTPLGRYPLGDPRSSVAYGTFIPIAYPTEAQRRAGFTGGAVGVHGPHRSVAALGPMVNAFDTTDGCVGIATDEEMKRIESWVWRVRPDEIVLR
jgi:murein L,D-transpeptidase YafK